MEENVYTYHRDSLVLKLTTIATNGIKRTHLSSWLLCSEITNYRHKWKKTFTLIILTLTILSYQLSIQIEENVHTYHRDSYVLKLTTIDTNRIKRSHSHRDSYVLKFTTIDTNGRTRSHLSSWLACSEVNNYRHK